MKQAVYFIFDSSGNRLDGLSICDFPQNPSFFTTSGEGLETPPGHA
jgi:hypothetical protein